MSTASVSYLQPRAGKETQAQKAKPALKDSDPLPSPEPGSPDVVGPDL